jgi:hypothetical protein
MAQGKENHGPAMQLSLVVYDEKGEVQFYHHEDL